MYSKQLQKSISEFEQGEKDDVFHIDLLWCELYGSINSDFWSGLLTERNANYLRQKYLFREEKQMKLSAVFTRKEPEITPKECVIEYVKLMNDTKFNHFIKNLLQDQAFIEDHIEDMYHDENGTLHAILALNEETGDGILIDSSGSSYARYSSFVPKIMLYLEQQIAMATEHIINQAVYENNDALYLDDLSKELDIIIEDDDGIAELFVKHLKSIPDIDEFELGDEMIIVKLNQEMYPKQNTGMEMK